MKLKETLAGAAILMFCGSLTAAPLLTEGFEKYARGTLDANFPGGPNNNTNNGWAGPSPPPCCQIAGAETTPNGISVTPHGGTNMVRGTLNAGDFDEDIYNLSYWLNATNSYASFLGNFSVDWWFFDSVGQGTNGASPTQYCDFFTVSLYTTEPNNQPYDPNMASDGLDQPTTSFGIGGDDLQDVVMTGSNELSGYDSTKYQALGVPASGYDGNGWFNIPSAVRSVGWHHARIEVLPVMTNGYADTAFYVDNMSVPGLRILPFATNGFNYIGLNANFCTSTNISAYWDDISFSLLSAPKLNASFSASNVVLSWTNSWILQSSTNLAASWTDVVDANTNFVTSSYTNSFSSGAVKFFRLRN